jgi:hypothetical protein
MIKALELKGLKTLPCLNAFHALILGLKMLPQYQGWSYEDFLEMLHKLTPPEQEKFIREACLFVRLEPDEVEAMVLFCTDANGVPYTAENIKNLGPADLIEIIVAVSMAVVRLNIYLVTDSEKKNSKTSQ